MTERKEREQRESVKLGQWPHLLNLQEVSTFVKSLSEQLVRLTVLPSVKGLYSSRPPGGAERVTCVTEGSYKVARTKWQLRWEGLCTRSINYKPIRTEKMLETRSMASTRSSKSVIYLVQHNRKLIIQLTNWNPSRKSYSRPKPQHLSVDQLSILKW